MGLVSMLGAVPLQRLKALQNPKRLLSLVLTSLPNVQVVLFDVQQRTATGELSCPFLKYAVWSGDMAQVALLSKHAIIIADKRLQNATTGARPSCIFCVVLY